jgi:hypothetical protein
MVSSTPTAVAVGVVLSLFSSPSAAHEWLFSDDHNLASSDLVCTAANVNHSKIVVAAVGDSITCVLTPAWLPVSVLVHPRNKHAKRQTLMLPHGPRRRMRCAG